MKTVAVRTIKRADADTTKALGRRWRFNRP